MNEEKIEDRHSQYMAKRSHETRKAVAELIAIKAQELAKLMTELGQYGISTEIDIHQIETAYLGAPDTTYVYSAEVLITEPPVVLASTRMRPR